MSRVAPLLAFAAVYALVPIREWWVTGIPWPIPPAGPIGAYRLWWLNPWAAMHSVWHNALFMLGFPGAVNPAYRMRPHWLVLWALVIWGWSRAPRLLRLYVLLYVATMLVTPVIGVYGFRHVLGLMMMLVLFVAPRENWP